jgi:hypothetical protein
VVQLNGSSQPTDQTCKCKVDRVIDEYGLDSLNAELYRRRDEGASLRRLATYVNQRVLTAALDSADVDVTNALHGALGSDEAIETLYKGLNDDDVPTERTARVRTRLSQLGVDVAEMEDDWVTHPTVRKHLRECLYIDTRRTASIYPDDARDTIAWARTRCANVVAQMCRRLRNANVIATGPLDVMVTIQFTCTNCGETYRLETLLDRRSCNCTLSGD